MDSLGKEARWRQKEEDTIGIRGLWNLWGMILNILYREWAERREMPEVL